MDYDNRLEKVIDDYHITKNEFRTQFKGWVYIHYWIVFMIICVKSLKFNSHMLTHLWRF